MPDHSPRGGSAAFDPDADDKRISLLPVLTLLRRYRQVLMRGLILAAGAIAVVVFLFYLLLPSDVSGSLRFRVLFDGAEQGLYPNKTKFGGADIVAPPVISEVYKAIDLKRYMPFSDFKNGIFVLQANSQLEMLSYEYQAKLADPRLTPVDRARIEDEFRRKRESLSSAELSLNFRGVQRIKALPESLVAQMLGATLDEWARQARERRGAVKYDIPVLSRNILQHDVIANDDYIVAVDVLRAKVNRILENLEDISEIPGAMLVRGSKGESLAEIRSNLQDLVRFEIEPSISLITSRKLTKNPERARVYVQDQLRQLGLARQSADQRMKAIQDPLREYVTMTTGGQLAGGIPSSGNGQAPVGTSGLMPQLSESFLKQIVDLSTQNNDSKYRQALTDRVIAEGLQAASDEKERAYYDNLSKSVGLWTKSPDSADSKELVAQLEASYQRIATSLDEILAIYDEVSSRNLNPSTQLFQVTTPFAQRTERTVSLTRLVGFGAIAFIFVAVALLGGCLIHNQYRLHVGPVRPPIKESERV